MSSVAAILIVVSSCIAFPDDPLPVEDFTIAEFPLATAWHSGAQCMAFLSDREVVAVCFDVPSEKWYHHAWDFRSKRQLRKIAASSDSYNKPLDVSPDGESILACNRYGLVEILSKSGKKIVDFKVFENQNYVLEAKFLSNDEVGVVADNILLRRNFRTNQNKLYRLKGESFQGATIVRNPGTLCWAAGKSLHVWKPMLKENWDVVEIWPTIDPSGHVACSDDGSVAMCASLKSELELLDVKTKRSLKKWSPHKGSPLAEIAALKGITFRMLRTIFLKAVSEQVEFCCYTLRGHE